MTDTYNNWINWYHQRPSDGGVTPPSDDGDDSTPVADPVDVGFGTAAPQDFSEKNFMVEGSIGSLKRQKKNIAAIDFGTIKYASLDEYLNATQLGDRSGFFSSVDFKDTTGKDRRKTSALNSLPLSGLGLLPFSVALMESEIIKDPTGKFNRAIPKSGVFNVAASMAIAEEYRELYNIRDHQLKNPDLKGIEAGFGFSVGSVNIYRRPGESLYRGQLDRAGLNQQTAKSMEQYVSGTQKGTELVSAMLRAADGDDIDPGSVALNDSQRAILQTENGGYLLNGNFHFGSGIAAYGYEEDMVALGASVFSANGMLPETQSTALARQWRASAKALPRNATAAEKLANLNAHIRAATTLHQSTVAAAAAEQAYQQERPAQEAAMETYREEQRQREFDLRMYGTEGNDEGERAARESRERSRVERTAEALNRESKGGRRETFARGFQEGGEIPAEDEPFIAGAPDGNEPMISGNELLEAAGDESGFVERPPSEVSDEKSVADDKPMVAKEEGMVLNAEAVKIAGEQDVAKMIKDAEDYVRSSGKEAAEDDREATDIQISEGEVYISPQLADAIGRDRLRKINDRGLPRTEEKIQKAARGGKVGYALGDEVQSFMDQPEEIPDTGEASAMAADIPETDLELFRGYLSKRGRHQRKDVENLIDNLSERGRLALLMLTETTALADPLESMEAVGQVAVNRMNTNDPDFDEVTSLKEVLKQRSKGRGSGSKMFQFDGLEPTSVKDRLTEVMGGGAQAALDKIYSAADNVIDMNPRLGGESADGREPAIPLGVLYYKKPGSEGGSFMDKRHYIEPYTTIGGHQFYDVNFEFPGRHSGR